MEKTVSIMEVADRIKRHPMLKEIPFETILSYTVDFIRITGIPEIYDEKTEILEIKDYRALLPCDYIYMLQVRDIPSDETYRAATDTFHMSEHKHKPVGLTYRIQNNVIYTSKECGKLEIAYKSIAVDEDGYPLLPDSPSFLRGLESYVKKQWFTIRFDMGLTPQYVLNQALQDYAFNVGAAISDLRFLSIDKAESLFNSWSTLMIRHNEHKHGFRNDGAKELLKVH